MKRRHGAGAANPSRALNWRGAHVRIMKSDGSKMKSSYSAAVMYSPSTYWYIASSGSPLPGQRKAR